jgi:hypothetical protein
MRGDLREREKREEEIKLKRRPREGEKVKGRRRKEGRDKQMYDLKKEQRKDCEKY